MVHRSTDRSLNLMHGSRKARAFLLLLLLNVVFISQPLFSYAQDNNIVLPDSGIKYPGGFDENTVGVVQGRAYEFIQPAKGPVQFRLDSGKENYITIVSPAWYWKDLGVKIPDGTEVKVRGSKSLGKDGKLYIVAQEMVILSTGKVYAFRTDNGYPLWKGGSSGTRGIGGGYGSQNRFGSGINGMGKGMGR